MFFRGADAGEKELIEFVNRPVKLRGPDEETPAEEGDDYITLEEESVQKVGDYEENDTKFEELHRGIMVIKCEYKEEEPEKDKDKDKEEDKQAEKKEEEAGGDDEAKQSKTQMYKYVRAFLPQWLKGHDENRCVYETKMEVKMVAAATKTATKLSLNDDDDDGKTEQKLKKEKKAEKLEENNILIVSDNRCNILCVIVKGIQGE